MAKHIAEIGISMSGNRFALLIASCQYEDTNFKKLTAPANDVTDLAIVLRNPTIGNFEVKTSLNDPHYIVRQLIEDFFQDRKKDDLLLLYFSGHGFKEIGGPLYFVTSDTRLRRLRSTGISASFINDLMQTSNSRRQVLILDCCFSGAFIRGMVSKGNKTININEYFNGFGKVILTSSDSTQYAFEGEKIFGEGVRSIFTNAIVHGLETGEADIDGDNCISITDLFHYVDNCVNREYQRPTISTFSQQGEIYIARNPNSTFLKKKEEAERIKREEAERKQREELLRTQKEKEIKQREEAERKQREELLRTQKEKEIKQRDELLRTQKEKEIKQREEAERKQREKNKIQNAILGFGITLVVSGILYGVISFDWQIINVNTTLVIYILGAVVLGGAAYYFTKGGGDIGTLQEKVQELISSIKLKK